MDMVLGDPRSQPSQSVGMKGRSCRDRQALDPKGSIQTMAFL